MARLYGVIAIDGMPLEAFLKLRCPDRQVEDLVSTLLGWMDDEKDYALVLERILPAVGSSSVAPLLVCPDDLDFWCTVVVAEVVSEANVIRWTRLGLDRSAGGKVGECVEWFDNVPSLSFPRPDYEAMLAQFRARDEEASARKAALE